MKDISLNHFFATLSSPRRVKVLQLLNKNGPTNVSGIADGLEIEQSAISHCLTKLLDCHFVEVEQDGKERIYSLNSETIKPLLRQIETHVDKYCVESCNHKK
ncbi:helix-turn-helix transcriptional regulator [Candidatus Saccharibacteria bacterium]|nr:helix-turn-helix transcriptional regulator [Candidatus Saccharibacteria bacterium]